MENEGEVIKIGTKTNPEDKAFACSKELEKKK